MSARTYGEQFGNTQGRLRGSFGSANASLRISAAGSNARKAPQVAGIK